MHFRKIFISSILFLMFGLAIVISIKGDGEIYGYSSSNKVSQLNASCYVDKINVEVGEEVKFGVNYYGGLKGSNDYEFEWLDFDGDSQNETIVFDEPGKKTISVKVTQAGRYSDIDTCPIIKVSESKKVEEVSDDNDIDNEEVNDSKDGDVNNEDNKNKEDENPNEVNLESDLEQILSKERKYDDFEKEETIKNIQEISENINGTAEKDDTKIDSLNQNVSEEEYLEQLIEVYKNLLLLLDKLLDLIENITDQIELAKLLLAKERILHSINEIGDVLGK